MGNPDQGPAWQADASQAAAEILQEEQATNGFRLLPVTLEHVYALDSFPLHHRDPFDRLLIAQAHQEGLILVTHDPQFSVYPVPLLW